MKVIDAAATPGVFANMSTIKPVMKAAVKESHLEYYDVFQSPYIYIIKV